MGRTTVVLADDHPIVREGVRALFADQDDLAIVGETGDGLKVSELVERVKPDVLVLDLTLPNLSGLEVLRQVTRRFPRTRIVILSMHAADAYVLEAMRSGAAAYVVKDAIGTELIAAIREVRAGRRYLSAPLSERAIEVYLEQGRPASLDPFDTLTTREREVLRLAAGGRTSGQIATQLSISPRTAETHRANLMHKLGLHSQTDLVRYAMRRGLLPESATPSGGPARA